MKTLEQWQKELPDYDVWRGKPLEGDTGSGIEVLLNPDDREFWVQISRRNGIFGFEVTGYHFVEFIPIGLLYATGCTFRRKKERQREFKIEYDEEFSYTIDGDKHTELGAFFEKRGILSATLTVNEWGGE